MHPEFETGYDTEISSTAADRPKQIRMVFSIDKQNLTVCGYYFSSQQVIDSQAVLTNQVANPSTQRNTANPNRSRIAKPGDKAMRCGSVREFSSS